MNIDIETKIDIEVNGWITWNMARGHFITEMEKSILEIGNIYIYFFNFRQKNFKEGKGRYIYLTGDVYHGYWVKNKKQGHGILTRADGSRFEGFFDDS